MAGVEAESPVGFDAWIAGRSAALTRFAYLLTGSEVAGEQALAPALTITCATWRRVRRRDDPEAYVQGLVVQAHLARRGLRRRRPSYPPPAPPKSEGTNTPDDAAQAWRVCAALAPTERATVVLRCYAEKTYPQIAAMLETNEAAARGVVERCFAVLSSSIGAKRTHGQLKAAFRDAFAEHAEDPSDSADRTTLAHAGAVNRRRRRVAVGVAAGVVLLAGVVGAADTLSRSDTAAADQPGDHPRGWRAESYSGIQLWVPSSWGWGEVPRAVSGGFKTCGVGAYSSTAVTTNLRYAHTDGISPPYVGRPAAPGAPCPRVRPTTAAHVWFDSPLPVGSGPVKTTVHVNGVTSFNITVADANRAERRTILRSLRPARLDSYGCPRDSRGLLHVQALSWPEPTPALVRNISLCLYAAGPANQQVLFYSTRIEGLADRQTTARIESAPRLRSAPTCLVTPARNQMVLIARSRAGASVFGINPGTCHDEPLAFFTGSSFHVQTSQGLRLWATNGFALYAEDVTDENRLTPFLPSS